MDMLKEITENVENAIKEQKTFTLIHVWPVVEKTLEDRGWVQKLHENVVKTKPRYRPLFQKTVSELLPYLESKTFALIAIKLIKSKLLENHKVDLVWFGNCFALDDYKIISDRNKISLVNKFRRISADYTSKIGLRKTQKTAKQRGLPLSHPRTYILKQESNSFWNDYNITSAMSLLKYIKQTWKNKSTRITSPSGKIPFEVFEFAIEQCARYTHRKGSDYNKWIGGRIGWEKFHEYMYQMVHEWDHFKINDDKETEEGVVAQASEMLQNINHLFPDLEIDGYCNIWILKPYDKCRGIGIRLCCTRKSILNAMQEEDLVVQKYIECPLLIYGHKFDIRQWYLVASSDPLTIWMWTDCYIRFSCQTYSVRKLHESIHISSNCIQSKYFEDSAKDLAIPDYYMWSCQEYQNYLALIGYPNAFKAITYPGMKENIISATVINKNILGTRENCFELFGADFMVTPDFKARLIELNDNPSMVHTTPVLKTLCPRFVGDVMRDNKIETMGTIVGGLELIYKEEKQRSQATK